MKVSEILQVKGEILYTVTPDMPLVQAAATMAERDIGSLVVMEYGDLVGMLTFREVIKAHPEAGGLITDCLSGDVNKDYSQLWSWISEYVALPDDLPYGEPAQLGPLAVVP